jgi:hypothetical protein
MPRVLQYVVSAAVVLAVATVAEAQVVETPIPFDSAGRVQVVTPPLAARLKLEAPSWPVTGDYTEARLFSGSDATFVIAVQRRNGAIERFRITPDDRERLRSAMTSSMASAGRPASEERSEMISEPAKGTFIRAQLGLSALYYAPALAGLTTNDPQTATAIWLLGTGGAFFVTASLAKNKPISRAQTHLSTDLAVRGSFMAQGLVYALTGKEYALVDSDPCCTGFDSSFDEERVDAKAYQAALLAGALGGAVAGYQFGKPLTDGEARAMTFGSTAMLVTTLGAMGTSGLLDETSDGKSRTVVGALVGAAALGLPLGLNYPRKATYAVTAGDVGVLGTAGVLGGLSGLTVGLLAMGDDDDAESGKTVLGLTTLGYVGGLVVGDRLFVRRFDHTEGESRLIGAGALAGALMGVAFDVVAEPNNAGVAMIFPTAGAILGAFATSSLVEPKRTGLNVGSMTLPGSMRNSSSRTGMKVQLSPTNAAFAAAGVKGRFPILSMQF